MITFRTIGNFFRRLLTPSDGQRPNRDRDVIRFVKTVSLECVRCRGLSPPVKGTSDQYQCVKCLKQFPGPSHHIDQAIWRASALTAKQKADLKQNYDIYTRSTSK
jgi:hypothetical protein